RTNSEQPVPSLVPPFTRKWIETTGSCCCTFVLVGETNTPPSTLFGIVLSHTFPKTNEPKTRHDIVFIFASPPRAPTTPSLCRPTVLPPSSMPRQPIQTKPKCKPR
ncbi:unnamed protein product, partial [Ectocarpus sp. 12 AP-2014]